MKIKKVKPNRYWTVMKVIGWSDVKVNGAALSEPDTGMHGFIPVFYTREQAVAFDNGCGYYVAEVVAEPLDPLYKKWTTHKKTSDGYEIKCRKRLWRVFGPDKEAVEKEAKHYFIQYYNDGEYET